MCIWWRSGRSFRRDTCVMSSPFSRIVPSVGSSSLITQFATVLLPLPDSPTRPSSSPGAIENETPSTACTVPLPPMRRPEPKCLTRSTTSSVGTVPPLTAQRRSAPGWKHATRCSGRISRSSGSSERVRSSARGQRGANAHAAGSSASDGTRPGISRSRPCSSAAPGRGIAPSRPIVYGCCGRAYRSCTGASSTFRPAYMTITRSAMSATTPRLCVIRMIAVPSRSRMSRSRSRIPAWIVTSSAVVGSSAIRIFGSQASAIAIITRWRMPPESWCGYSSIAPIRRRDADEVEQFDRALAGGPHGRARGAGGAPPRSGRRSGTPG